MKISTDRVRTVRRWRDARGQDLIEYALMAGLVAMAAGAMIPDASLLISRIFSQVSSGMTGQPSQSSQSQGS
jgi:pilus assembly protein Flp/PilA